MFKQTAMFVQLCELMFWCFNATLSIIDLLHNS